ncbi:LuxR family transcriptional regulator [Streptomyces sp. FH025]|uniref:LuxR family transcriptional regulator n=1 Tax=Streptomyces sp. FH025 TaxID=2815937 RepID=UPI001A9E8450|nr:LuxR family transcriptional regulator [Streptomyces sp. FH025]MBO1418463.1 hypothetical protein [Streptomyces sp. FH025]
MGLSATEDDTASAVEHVIELVQGLADAPVHTLRRIACRTSVTHVIQLTEALLRLAPAQSSASWLRCLLAELYFIAGRPRDSLAVVAAVSGADVPWPVAESAAVARMLSSAQLDPQGARTAARHRIEAADRFESADPAAIAAGSVLADERAQSGDVEGALYWSRLVATHAGRVPSPFWSAHLLLKAAARLADAGEDEQADALCRRVREQLDPTPYPGLEAGLAHIQAKILIRRGQWATLDARCHSVAATATPDRAERLHAPPLLAQLSIAALYTGDVPTARALLEESRRLLSERDPALRNATAAPELLWARLLLEEKEAGRKRVVNHLNHLLRDPRAPLRELFATVAGSAAWAAQTAVSAGKRALAEQLATVTEEVCALQPARAALTAEHVRGIVRCDSVALARVATAHRDAWAKARAAADLATSLEAAAALAPASRGEPGRHRDHRRLVAAATASAAPRPVILRTPTAPDGGGAQPVPPETGWTALSEREQQVARLAAAGLTNRQIASRLLCSIHTVNFHLRSVFRKLVIDSRVRIAEHVPA